ncbi:MAG: hypothetical protein KC492_08780, partial [Myxococcales bacterium]|nr:hypothetical protein [Myxococcales bacterium]
ALGVGHAAHLAVRVSHHGATHCRRLRVMFQFRTAMSLVACGLRSERRLEATVDGDTGAF